MKKFKILILPIFLMVSCSSPKKVRKDVIVSDSDFLKNGQVIENFKPKEKESKVVDKKSSSSKTSKTKKADKTAPVKGKKEASSKEEKPARSKKIETIVNNETWGFPFVPGEKVVLSAKYFGMEAGKITLGMFQNKKVNGKKAAHFYAEGRTSSIFAMVYKIKDKVESLWDPVKKRPFLIAFHIDESKQKREIRTHFKWDKGISTTVEEGWKKKKGDYKEKKTYKIAGTGQDIMSAFFYMRTLPLEVGKTYTYNVFEEDKLVKASIFVEKREVLSTRLGKFKSLVLIPNFKVEGKFKKVGDIRVWVTDDKYRQIIRIESKIKIGTIVAKLHSLTRP